MCKPKHQEINLGLVSNFFIGFQLLYRAPRPWVHTNDWLSDAFSLHRGTRKGCPLSPTLFALALEPFAILVRESSEVWDLWVKGFGREVILICGWRSYCILMMWARHSWQHCESLTPLDRSWVSRLTGPNQSFFLLMIGL